MHEALPETLARNVLGEAIVETASHQPVTNEKQVEQEPPTGHNEEGYQDINLNEELQKLGELAKSPLTNIDGEVVDLTDENVEREVVQRKLQLR
jgi:hypothetical protein